MPTIGETSENASANADRRVKSLIGFVSAVPVPAWSPAAVWAVSDMGFSA